MKFFSLFAQNFSQVVRPDVIIALKKFLVNDFLRKCVDNSKTFLKKFLRIFNLQFSVFKFKN